MNTAWRTEKIVRPSGRPPHDKFDYTYNVDSVLVNDANEDQANNDGSWTAQNTEIYVDKGKDTLLITLGDSWSHGEGHPDICHIKHQWELFHRIEVPYGGKMARILDTDYWTFTRPGQSNNGIYTGLFRILDSIPVGKYKSIKVVVQMTENSRERYDKVYTCTKLSNLILPHANLDMTVQEWIYEFDKYFFDILDSYIKNSPLPLDVVVFKHLTKCYNFPNPNTYSFRYIDTTWIEYAAKFCGLKIVSPYVVHSNFYEIMIDEPRIKYVDRDFASEDLDKFEKELEFLSTNNCVIQGGHPTEVSQALWATYLLTWTGWDATF